MSVYPKDTPHILAIIPAHNEAANIERVMHDLNDNAPFVDTVIVDDGSTDDTLQICKRYKWEHISLPVNLGLADAFQTGMRYASAKGYDYALQFDADGQHCADYIETMAKTAQDTNAQIVIGSRYAKQKKPFSPRMIGSSLISFLIRLTTGQWIDDPTSGMRLYNKEAIESFANKYDYGPEPDTLALLMRQGFNVIEVPVSMRERQAGESYLSLHQSAMYMARMFVSLLLVQWIRN